MLLKLNKISEDEIKMEIVTCDCCGGWSTEGIVCENCLADAEARQFVWVDEKEYPQAFSAQREVKEESDVEE